MPVATLEDVGSGREQFALSGKDIALDDDVDLRSDSLETVPSIEEQKTIIREALKTPLTTGKTWYLLDIHWYKQWKKFVDPSPKDRDDGQNPGPIDNSPLFQLGTRKLKEHLLEGSDYKLIPANGWNDLMQWYQLTPDQEPIARKVVEHGLYIKETKVEVYLIELKLSIFKDLDHIEVYDFSKATTIGDVVEKMKNIFNISEEEETRVWNKFMPNTYELISKLENTLQDYGTGSGQMLVLEQKNENNEWPRTTRSRSLSSSSGMNIALSSNETGISTGAYSPITASTFGSRQRHLSIKPGLCGLSNIGNTCFMSSSLQCLSNTTPLTKYFMSETYKHELNPTNPLGMHGKIAEAYADLMRNMWGGHNTFFTPRHFKMQVGRFAPQFSGYQQQDSHELLAFLLDGLHEDLNRVKQKPYIELQDDKGRPDQVVAAEAWRNHSLRNSSIIVDLFHGQFKSTVECPVCCKRSVTFDPFCYLSLPLPIKKERNITLTFVPLETFKKPVKLKVIVPKAGNTADLTNAIAKVTGTDPEKLVVTDVFGSKFHKRFIQRDSLSQITDRDDIYVYEIPINAAHAETEELLVLPVYLREIKPTTSKYSYTYSYSSNSLFGVPLLVPVPRANTTTADLYSLILRAMRRFVHTPTPDAYEQDKVLKGEEQEDETMEEDDEDEAKVKNDTQEKECETKQEEPIDEKPETCEPVTLFDMKIVNSAGTQEIRTLAYDDKEPLKLTSKSQLAIDWYPKLKKKYYNEELARDIVEHESLHSTPQAKRSTNLSDCLDLFLQREKLGEEDPWFCPQCKEHRQAFKKFDLWTLPKILVIHLKRFSYNRYWRDKIDALVDFPITQLDMTKYVINKNHPRAVYDLHAVSNHYGGLGGGHYTAYGINHYDGQWYYYDDSSVTPSDASSPVSKAAYVLFYTRRDDPENEMMNTSELLTEDTDVFENDLDME